MYTHLLREILSICCEQCLSQHCIQRQGPGGSRPTGLSDLNWHGFGALKGVHGVDQAGLPRSSSSTPFRLPYPPH